MDEEFPRVSGDFAFQKEGFDYILEYSYLCTCQPNLRTQNRMSISGIQFQSYAQRDQPDMSTECNLAFSYRHLGLGEYAKVDPLIIAVNLMNFAKTTMVVPFQCLEVFAVGDAGLRSK